MSTEAMKLALEALNSFPHRHLTPLVSDARTALREALAQPEPDCVLVPRDLIGAACSAIDRKRDAPKTLEQLRRYTVGDLSTTQPAQPQQEPVAAVAWQQGYDQGVADERISEANIGIAGFNAKVNPARNNPYTSPQPAPVQQEPVAWMHEWEDGEKIPMLKGRDDRNQDKPETVRPLVYGDTSPQPAQPQQEPVAWRVKWPAIGGGHKWLMVDRPLMEKEGFVNEALYTSPPAQEFVCSTGLCHYRKPLKDEEIETVWRSVQANDFHDCVKPFARAVEAAHGIEENT